MIHKKLCRILGISSKPVSGISQAKTVAPGVHIPHQAVTPSYVDMIRQYKLQITHG